MSTRDLTVLQPGQITRSREWHDAARRARWLSWLSLAWMGAEGVIALTAGILAGATSAFSCRIYRGKGGASEQPEESWVRDALIEAAK